tara:strand:- start:134 stop:1417 length:1284 start_codon:yes stop_codon:yes gene_type:complete
MIKNLKFISGLFKSSSIYTISGIINSAIPFFFLPILTRILSPSDYGIIAMFQICVSVAYPFVGLNLESAIARKYYEKTNSKFSSFIGATVSIGTFTCLILSIIFWIFSKNISDITQIPSDYIVFIIFLAYFRYIMNVLLTIFQVKLNPISYGLIQITHSFVSLSATLYLLFILSYSWESRILGQLVAGLFIVIICSIIISKNRYLSFDFSKIDFDYAISFGAPLIPHAIASVGLIVIDRFFLTMLVDIDATGIFTSAYQLGAVISLITISFNNAFVPWLFENLNKNKIDVKIKIVKLTYLYFMLITIFSSILIYIFPFVVKVFVGEKFYSINQYSYLIVLGFAFQGMFFMVTNYLYYVKKTYLQSIISFSVILIKIPLTYYLILSFGVEGAAWSFLIIYVFFFLITWIVSSREYRMPWNLLTINNYK